MSRARLSPVVVAVVMGCALPAAAAADPLTIEGSLQPLRPFVHRVPVAPSQTDSSLASALSLDICKESAATCKAIAPKSCKLRPAKRRAKAKRPAAAVCAGKAVKGIAVGLHSRQYEATWLVPKVRMGVRYHVNVRAGGLRLARLDLTTATRSQVPVNAGTVRVRKPVVLAFRIVPNATVRTRVARFRGDTPSEVAWVLRNQFHLDELDAFRALWNDMRNQDVVLPAPTAASRAILPGLGGLGTPLGGGVIPAGSLPLSLTDILDTVTVVGSGPAAYALSAERAAQLASQVTGASPLQILDAMAATKNFTGGAITKDALLAALQSALGITDPRQVLDLMTNARRPDGTPLFTLTEALAKLSGSFADPVSAIRALLGTVPAGDSRLATIFAAVRSAFPKLGGVGLVGAALVALPAGTPIEELVAAVEKTLGVGGLANPPSAGGESVLRRAARVVVQAACSQFRQLGDGAPLRPDSLPAVLGTRDGVNKENVLGVGPLMAQLRASTTTTVATDDDNVGHGGCGVTNLQSAQALRTTHFGTSSVHAAALGLASGLISPLGGRPAPTARSAAQAAAVVGTLGRLFAADANASNGSLACIAAGGGSAPGGAGLPIDDTLGALADASVFGGHPYAGLTDCLVSHFNFDPATLLKFDFDDPSTALRTLIGGAPLPPLDLRDILGIVKRGFDMKIVDMTATALAVVPVATPLASLISSLQAIFPGSDVTEIPGAIPAADQFSILQRAANLDVARSCTAFAALGSGGAVVPGSFADVIGKRAAKGETVTDPASLVGSLRAAKGTDAVGRNDARAPIGGCAMDSLAVARTLRTTTYTDSAVDAATGIASKLVAPIPGVPGVGITPSDLVVTLGKTLKNAVSTETGPLTCLAAGGAASPAGGGLGLPDSLPALDRSDVFGNNPLTPGPGGGLSTLGDCLKDRLGVDIPLPLLQIRVRHERAQLPDNSKIVDNNFEVARAGWLPRPPIVPGSPDISALTVPAGLQLPSVGSLTTLPFLATLQRQIEGNITLHSPNVFTFEELRDFPATDWFEVRGGLFDADAIAAKNGEATLIVPAIPGTLHLEWAFFTRPTMDNACTNDHYDGAISAAILLPVDLYRTLGGLNDILATSAFDVEIPGKGAMPRTTYIRPTNDVGDGHCTNFVGNGNTEFQVAVETTTLNTLLGHAPNLGDLASIRNADIGQSFPIIKKPPLAGASLLSGGALSTATDLVTALLHTALGLLGGQLTGPITGQALGTLLKSGACPACPF